jgi:Rieske 2Fe-2S family protein
VCELTQAGMSSRGFTPGRYTTQETDVHAFDVMVAERYLEAAPVAR